MSGSEAGVVPVRLRQSERVNADAGDLGPMSQQNAVSLFSHAVYPQKLLRLVGCHSASSVDVTRSDVTAIEQKAEAA